MYHKSCDRSQLSHFIKLPPFSIISGLLLSQLSHACLPFTSRYYTLSIAPNQIMSHPRSFSLVLISKVLPKQGGRSRKKLQKRCHQRVDPCSKIAHDDSRDFSIDNGVKPVGRHQAGGVTGPSIPQKPKFNDYKSPEYHQRNPCLHGPTGIPAPGTPVSAKESRQILSTVPPEFSHLGVCTTGPKSSLKRRQSLNRISANNPSSPIVRIRTLRRRAKTPVFAIGQLENTSLTQRHAAATRVLKFTADQYRALLDPGDYDAELAPRPAWRGRQADKEESGLQRRFGEHVTYGLSTDDRRPISLGGETIAVSPTASSPEPALQTLQGPDIAAAQIQYPPQENLCLEICLDLLSQELSAATLGPSHTARIQSSTLKIWLMIEAYERLRDQVRYEVLRNETNMAEVEDMFDTWIRALYRIYYNLMVGEPQWGALYQLEEVEEPL
jgi:hypothetical protein